MFMYLPLNDFFINKLLSFFSDPGGGRGSKGRNKILSIWTIEICKLSLANYSHCVCRRVWMLCQQIIWDSVTQDWKIVNQLIFLEVVCKCQIGFLSEIRLFSKKRNSLFISSKPDP